MNPAHPDFMRTVAPGLDSVRNAVRQVMDSPIGAKSLRGLAFFDTGRVEAELLLEAGVDVTIVHGHASDLPEIASTGVTSILLSDLIEQADSWDIAVLTSGFDRFLRTSSKVDRQRLFEWLAQHCTMALISAPLRILDSTLNQLGPHRLTEIFDAFSFVSEATPSEVAGGSPILLASKDWLFAGGTWHRGDDLRLLKRSPAHPELETRASCYVSTQDLVIKTELVNTDYFERSQTLREALFLRQMAVNESRGLELPSLQSFTHGSAVVTSTRSAVSGKCPGHGAAFHHPKLCKSVVALAGRYAESGLFHNDLRPWNVLWDGDTARFIDFADTSSRDSDTMGVPQVVALVGTLLYFQGFPIGAGEAFIPDLTELLLDSRSDTESFALSLFDAPWLGLANLNEDQLQALAEHPLGFWERISPPDRTAADINGGEDD